MSNETPTIQATVRDKTGSKYAKRLRRDGQLPAVVYGHKEDPVHVAIPHGDFIGHFFGGVHLLEVEADGKGQTCLIKDVQYDYLGTTVVHVDLTRVDLNEEIEVSVPVELKGEEKSPGAKTGGAMVEQPITDLSVICKANAIPENIVVDISAMEVGDSISVENLDLPAGVRTEQNASDLVVAIHLVKEEEETEEATADSAEPEVLSEKKDEDGDDKSGD